VAQVLRYSDQPMGPDARSRFSEGLHTRLRLYCNHDGAREVRLYTSYADANALRLRLQSSDRSWPHISTLYEIPGGWAWTMCQECPIESSRRRAVGE
jgi:hypothetical protein